MGLLNGGGAAGVRSALVEGVPVVGASAWVDPAGIVAYHGSAGVALRDQEDEGGWYARGRVYYAPRIPARLVPCIYVGADYQQSRARVSNDPPDDLHERGLGAWFGVGIGRSLPAAGGLINPFASAQIGYVRNTTSFSSGSPASSHAYPEVRFAAASGVTVQYRRLVIGLRFLIVAEDYGMFSAHEAMYDYLVQGPELRLAWSF